jgi:hypothetical protein
MGILMTAFLSMTRSQTKAARNIAASGGVTGLAHGLAVLFGSPGCATLGTASFSNACASPVAVSVGGGTDTLALDTIRAPSNGVTIVTSGTNQEQDEMIRPHRVAAIELTALGAEGSSGSGFVYPFRLTVKFSTPSDPPPLPVRDFITIDTDMGRNVVCACAASPVGGGAAYASVYRTGPVVIPSKATWFDLPFNGELLLYNMDHSIAANSHVIRALESGMYQVPYSVDLLDPREQGTCYVRLVKNGIEVPGTIGSVGTSTTLAASLRQR